MVEELELSFTRNAPLRAWRLFRVRRLPDGYALGSPMIHSPTPPPWRPGLQVARCIERDHPAPAPGCRCGIYGAIEGTLDSLPGYLRDTAHDSDPSAYAEIGCSGRVFVDARGLRCEEAALSRVAVIGESFTSAEECESAADGLAERYGVPVESSDAVPAWLTMNAREHGAPPGATRLDIHALVRGLSAAMTR